MTESARRYSVVEDFKRCSPREKREIVHSLGILATLGLVTMGAIFVSLKDESDRRGQALQAVENGGGYILDEIIKDNAYSVKLNSSLESNGLATIAIQNAMRSIQDRTGCPVAGAPTYIPSENKAIIVVNCPQKR